MNPWWVTWVTLGGNIVGGLSVLVFALAYSRIRFERSPLGISLMSAAVSTLLLAAAAVLSRLRVALHWGWPPGWVPSLLVGGSWLVLAAAYAYLTVFLLRVQREERGL